jgi:hypothetical protein
VRRAARALITKPAEQNTICWFGCAAGVNNRLMVYPAPIFLFVGVMYLLLCCATDLCATWLLSRRRTGRAGRHAAPLARRVSAADRR